MLKILPPIWYFIFLIAGLLVHFYIPVARVFTFSYPIVGIVLLIAGQALSMYASALFSKEKTEILPTSETNSKLVVYGPFKYSRNPMYLGMVLSLLGIAVWAGTLPMFVAAFLDFCVLNFVFIPFEERKMSRIFGASYEEYRHKVRPWI
jgi:protein-S-isoprenylcysteine O-methyltransferase Ste14